MSFLLIIIEITNYDQRQIGNEHIYDQSCGASRDPDLQSRDFEVLHRHTHYRTTLGLQNPLSNEDWQLGSSTSALINTSSYHVTNHT